MALISFQNLTFTYPGASSPALRSVSLEVERGEMLCVMGRSGSGKTTLIRQLKTPLVPRGQRSGCVCFADGPVDAMDPRDQARLIGFVGHDPEAQLVCDTVGAELAFGLENLGVEPATMAMRVAETASYFGLQELMDCPVDELSGGQKQLVNLAAVLAMRPSVLVLDEPTSQLDPLAAARFLDILATVSDDLAMTVIVTEQRLEAVFPLADRVAVLDDGQLIAAGTPQEVALELSHRESGLCAFLPSAARIYLAVEGAEAARCPLTVRSGRRWLEDYVGGRLMKLFDPLLDADGSEAGTRIKAAVAACVSQRPVPETADAVLQLRDLWFRYGRDLPDVLRGLSLTVGRGELFALVGSNGAGKSTALAVAAGLRKPYRGTARMLEQPWALLPQDPVLLFSQDTVRGELEVAMGDVGAEGSAVADDLRATTVRTCLLEGLLDRHPLDLSAGEQQRVALAKALMRQPAVLLLDEPTKGLDSLFKAELGSLLRRLTEQGITIVVVSHDVEFCAQWATRVGLLFDGSVVAEGAPSALFSAAAFYTTAASRIAGEALPGAVTVDDVVSACRAL